MKEYLQNRAILDDKMKQLQAKSINGAPNPQAFALFQQQNFYLLKRQNELSQIISQQQARNPLPAPPPLQVPPDASPQLRAFLTAHDQLVRDQVAFSNQHRNDSPAKRQAALQKWQQDNAPRFKQLEQEAQAMAQTSPAQAPSPTTK